MDAHLRQLERNAATGDVQAEAQLLLERVRCGDLAEDKLHDPGLARVQARQAAAEPQHGVSAQADSEAMGSREAM